MPQDNQFPELVFQKAHGPGADEHSFEDALRELVRNSPYLGISLLLHGAVLFAFMQMKLDVAPVEETKKIVATQEDIEEPLPPEPPEPPEIEEIEEVIDEPVISEDVVTEVTEVIDSLPSDAPFESTGANDVVGVGGGGGGFGGRGKLGRRGKPAGNPHQQTVENALIWLKNHQSPDGYWAANEFELECGKLGDDICTGRGSVKHDVGVTGLALLAFLGAGHTHKEGKYKKVVKAGLKFLVDMQKDNRDGNYGDPNISVHTYDHCLALLAVIEAYALTKDYAMERSAKKGLDYLYSLRNPGAAWRYANTSDPDMIAHPNDVSVTGWAIMAMTLAKEYDIDIDQTALEDSITFVEEMTDSSGRTGYWERGGGSSRPEGLEEAWPVDETEAMTAVVVLCRIFVDPNLERPGNKEAIEKGVQLMMDLPIVIDQDNKPGHIDYYYWYYATYALYQWEETWNDWKRDIDKIAELQIDEGDAKGSWDPQLDPWSTEGGRVYSTAILALLMEVYYRYDNVMGSH